MDSPFNLVNHFALCAFPETPLFSIHGAQVSLFIGPFVPDPNPVFLQVSDIGIPTEKPEQFVNDTPQMDTLGSDQRLAGLRG